MTPEEFRKRVTSMKCNAFNHLRQMSNDEELMKTSGFNSLKEVIDFHGEAIDRVISKWEKEHPNDCS